MNIEDAVNIGGVGLWFTLSAMFACVGRVPRLRGAEADALIFASLLFALIGLTRAVALAGMITIEDSRTVNTLIILVFVIALGGSFASHWMTTRSGGGHG